MDYIYILNKNTGEVHRLDLDGRSMEECNLDDVRAAGDAEEMEEAEALRYLATDPEKRCGHCFP